MNKALKADLSVVVVGAEVVLTKLVVLGLKLVLVLVFENLELGELKVEVDCGKIKLND